MATIRPRTVKFLGILFIILCCFVLANALPHLPHAKRQGEGGERPTGNELDFPRPGGQDIPASPTSNENMGDRNDSPDDTKDGSGKNSSGGKDANSGSSVSTQPNPELDPKLAEISVPGVVTTASKEYSELLEHSLLFYEAQRSGKLPSDNRVKWRNSSSLRDGYDNRVDLEGGYYDAGNYIKATFPLSFTLNLINWGALEYFEGYVLANQTEFLRSMVKWGTDWLKKAHPSANELYVQVGVGRVENNYWGPDTDIPTPRYSYKIDANKTGTDVAAEAAAAFASSALLFRRLAQHRGNATDQQYADELIKHAQELYQFAELRPYNVYQDSVPSAKHVYPSKGYYDELFWGALWLYRATGLKTYLDTATKLYKDHPDTLANSPYPVDWDNKNGAAYVLAAQVTSGYCLGGPSGGILPATAEASMWRNAAEAYLDNVVDNQLGGTLTRGGLLWFDGTSNNNSLVASQNAAQLLLTYSSSVLRQAPDGQIPTKPMAMRAAKYESMALKQLDYLLGKNPINVMYVVGEHKNSPKNPHSAPAHGGRDVSNLLNPPQTAHVLLGAVVGGPDKFDQFTDDRRNWAQTEVSLDYNAPYQSNIARMVMYSAKDPFYVVTALPPSEAKPPDSNANFPPPPSSEDTSGGDGRPWAIRNLPLLIGVPVGVLVLAFGITLLIVYRFPLFGKKGDNRTMDLEGAVANIHGKDTEAKHSSVYLNTPDEQFTEESTDGESSEPEHRYSS
ncbi:uncharacterized protein VTP21DRAFT_6839 [Calcarisporiella thermophila]|uniref:uncharacterized protein n=1 Tax=Calcarisporiella thermophila TaxID=911321 RepID=UPI003743F3C3